MSGLRKPTPRHHPPSRLLSWHDAYVHVSGEVARVVVETSDRVEKIDHVWIEIDVGTDGRLSLSLSTCSRPSRLAGLDSRVRLGIVSSTWSELPAAAVTRAEPLDYGVFESQHPIEYLAHDRIELEKILLEKAGRAVCAEAWGEFYIRGQAGVHQIHSRRGSFAMPKDYVAQDGALQLYYEDGSRELLLFKFAGQP